MTLGLGTQQYENKIPFPIAPLAMDSPVCTGLFHLGGQVGSARQMEKIP